MKKSWRSRPRSHEKSGKIGRINPVRKIFGLTIKELSEKSGVPPTTIASLTNGKLSPVVIKTSKDGKQVKGEWKESVKTIAKALELEPKDLFPHIVKVSEKMYTNSQLTSMSMGVLQARSAEDYFLEKDYLEKFLLYIEESLDQKSRTIVIGIMLGKSLEEIGWSVDLTKQRIGQIVMELIQKLVLTWNKKQYMPKTRQPVYLKNDPLKNKQIL